MNFDFRLRVNNAFLPTVVCPFSTLLHKAIVVFPIPILFHFFVDIYTYWTQAAVVQDFDHKSFTRNQSNTRKLEVGGMSGKALKCLYVWIKVSKKGLKIDFRKAKCWVWMVFERFENIYKVFL